MAQFQHSLLPRDPRRCFCLFLLQYFQRGRDLSSLKLQKTEYSFMDYEFAICTNLLWECLESLRISFPSATAKRGLNILFRLRIPAPKILRRQQLRTSETVCFHGPRRFILPSGLACFSLRPWRKLETRSFLGHYPWKVGFRGLVFLVVEWFTVKSWFPSDEHMIYEG